MHFVILTRFITEVFQLSRLLTHDCLDHSSWFKHKSTSFCSAHGIGVIVLPKLRVATKDKAFSAHSVARLGEGSHLLLRCIYMRMLRAACPASSYPQSRCHARGIICARGQITILKMVLSILLGFLMKSGQWRGTSALRSCSTRTSSHLLTNTVTVPQYGLGYSVTTPLSTSRTFDIWSLYMHITLSLKIMQTSIKSN